MSQGTGGTASILKPHVLRVSTHHSQSDYLSSILELTTRQVGPSAAFFAVPTPHLTWRVVASASQVPNCTIPHDATVRLGKYSSAAGSVIVDGADWASAGVTVTLSNKQGVDLGLLGVISPSDNFIPPDFVTTLSCLGRLLAIQLDLHQEASELRQSREEYRNIVDATAEGILLRTADGRIAAVNQTAEELLGVPADQLIGRVTLPVPTFLFGDDGSPSAETAPPGLRTVRSGAPVSNELIAIERPDGTSIWVSTNSRPLIDAGGTTPYAAVVSFVDVTDRLQAVQALRESEERFRTLSAASPVGIFLTDAGGRVLYVNPRCEEILNCPSGELLDQHLLRTIRPDDGDELFTEWQGALLRDDTFERELLVLLPNGDEQWAKLCIATLRDHQGKVSGLVGTLEDIQVRKRAETESRDRQDRLTILNSIAIEISAGMSVDQVIDRAVAQLAAHFPDRRVVFGQIDNRTRFAIQRSLQPPSMPSLAGQRRDLAVVPALLEAIRTGSVAVDDVATDDRLTPVAQRILRGGTKAFLDVLVRIGVEEVAILGLDSPVPYRWTTHETTTLQEVAAYLAVALSHARSEEQRRHAALEARRTAERFQSLVQHSSDVITIFDENTGRLYISPSFERILGYPPAEFVPMTQAQITHPDDLAAIEESFRQMRSQPGVPIATQFRARHRDGTWRWMESVATNLLDDPAVRGFVSNTRDITERRLAEEALHKSEARFRSAFEHALAGMALTDRDGHFEWVNESLCRMLGYSADELLARSFHAILHPDDLDAARDDSAKLFSGEQQSYQRERRFLQRGGGVIWGLLSASVLFDAENQPVQVIGQVQDITARKRMEAAVRQSDERYRALVSNSSDIITVLDADGVVRSMSQAVERVLGYAPEELIGKTNEELCHPQDRRRLHWALARSIRSPGIKRQVELRFCHRDGSWRWLEIVATALLGDPAIGGIVTDARDVTERKAVAAALQEANVQLERLNQAKSDFVSLVSHEFRTPLTGILGFSELIRDEELSVAEMKEFSNDINADAQRLGRMIDQLLDLDRMQSGRVQLQRGPVNLNYILRQVVQQLRAASTRHTMRLDIDEAAPSLLGDHDKLIQVFTNLIGNAVKYSPDGGEVEITTLGDRRSVHVTVRDPGVGIPPADLERIFDRYARVEGGAGRFIKGIGLGLPIARQIVELHGGRMWAESTLGEGSTFHVFLPVAGSLED